jgi:hypothetical protein
MQNHDRTNNKPTVNRQTNTAESSDEGIATFVKENRDLLSRILAHGDREAQGYALAAIANGADTQDIEEIQRLLDDLKAQKEG